MMSVLGRLRYLVSMLMVVGVVAALLLHLNIRISTATATSATVKSRSYSVGADYAGVLVEAYVDEGDTVEKGQPMFVVKSTHLARDISNGLVAPDKSPFEIRGGSQLVVGATSAGTVVAVHLLEGAFVAENAVLARVEVQDSEYIRADFRLTPKEYALMRKANSATITLPDQTEVRATITDVSVRTSGRQAQTRIEARADDLGNDDLFATGTPVDVQVRLRSGGLLDEAGSAISGLLTPDGER